MELELKHLSAYLPYGLKLLYVDCYNAKRKATLSGVTYSEIETTYSRKIKGCKGDIISFDGRNNIKDLKVKLILRPLSDLTKEIEHNGEKFVPCYYWDSENQKDPYCEHLKLSAIDYLHVEYLQYFIIEKLLEWHFDVFNLIPNGLAIDINTLNK